MRTYLGLLACLLLITAAHADLTIREIRYDGTLSDTEARFVVNLDVEATGKDEAATLFEGDVAVLTSKLPANLTLARDGQQYRLRAARAGRYKVTLDLVAKITRAEPWNSISFLGPTAAIGSVSAQVAGAGVELQLLAGTLQESGTKDNVTRVRGFLGAERQVALRWQSRAAEIARKALLTAETTVAVQITPTVIKYTTQLHYTILQGSAPRLTLTLPATQALTKLQGEQIRDWQIKPDGDHQLLTVEFIKAVEKSYALTLFSEQTVEGAAAAAMIAPPQPQEVERESGSLTVSAEDVLVETDSATGLRQVNAPAGMLAAYQFHARRFTLALKLRRIEPVINVADQVTARLEEARLLVTHALTLNVEKAGIYALELAPQPGFIVAEVKGEGVEDWKANDGKLAVNFSSRVLGGRTIEVQLEQAVSGGPRSVEAAAADEDGGRDGARPSITILPLRVTGAAKETAQIGASSVAGIQLKTVATELAGLHETPAAAGAGLAFSAHQADWKLVLAAERLAARVTADIFNLITIGDGLVGGSATIRYAILNQGVQELRVKVPSHWKNVEFTGPNIRRKEQAGDLWVIGLQEKAWGGYTLVVTYDFQFDPHKAALPVGGAHAAEVERETGSIAITSAANLQLVEARGTTVPVVQSEKDGQAKTLVPLTLRRIDELELAPDCRALVSRPVLLAYQYTGDNYQLNIEATRFEELPVLEAVADRTQLTTVLTDQGQMLTQASFMVKNNDRQFQRVRLPKGATLYSCFVNSLPAKPEKDGDYLLIPLPRGANRDQAFAVDILYEQKIGSLKSLLPRRVALVAPETDMQTTYAEWELYVPKTHRLAGFGGNMIVAKGTMYGLRDAWRKFVGFYGGLWLEAGVLIGTAAVLVLFAVLVVLAARRSKHGLLGALIMIFMLAVLAAMLLPSLGTRRVSTKLAMVNSNLDRSEVSRNEAGFPSESPIRESLRQKRSDVTHSFFEAPASALAPSTQPAQPGGGRAGNVPLVGDVPDGSRLSALDNVTSAEKIYRGNAEGIVNGVRAGVAVLPMAVAGIRPLRIELPRTGVRFVFTKVLNVRDEALSARAVAMESKVFAGVHGGLQAAAFVAGLALVWWQWRRERRNSVIVTAGLALAIGAVMSLLISTRTLHWVMILVPPVVAVGLVVWLIKRWWRAREAGRDKNVAPTSPVQPTGDAGGGVPPVVAAILVGLIAVNSVSAELVANLGGPGPADAATGIAIQSATYTGTVREVAAGEGPAVATVEAVLTLLATEPGQTATLFGEEVAVQEFTASPTSVKLLRDGKSVGVLMPKKGAATVKLKFLVKTGGDAAKRQLSFAIPPALASRVAVTLPEPDAAVEMPTAVSVKSSPEPGRDKNVAPTDQWTRVEAVIGAGQRVEFTWTPRVKRAAEVAATVFCQNAALVSIGGGVMNVRAVLDYQVTQGELRQVRVRLPAGQRLMRVEGDAIRTWKVEKDGETETLLVELVKGVTPGYRLTVETERALDAAVEPGRDRNVAPTKLTEIEIPHAMDVKRETGLVALRGAEELSLSVETAKELQKVDVEEFVKAWSVGALERGVTTAFRFLKPEFELAVRVEPVQPQIEVAVRNHLRVGTEQIGLSTQLDYTIKKAGVFVLKLVLPPDYRLERVTGENIAQWIEKQEQASRVLEVTLKERTTGAYSLRVDLVRFGRELPPTVAVVGVHPLGAQKLTGFVGVSADEGVEVKATTFDGLTEIPPAQTGLGAGVVLAYKFIQTEPQATPGWQAAVATEQLESWVRAEIVDWITLTETLASTRAIVRYEIQNAPTKEFRLKVPATAKNVEITGANIRRKDDTNGEWRVELQHKVRGIYLLTVTWETAFDLKAGTLAVNGVEALGVERETGTLAVVAPPALQVKAAETSEDLLRVDARELPEWATDGAPGGRALPQLVYRYLRPGYKLALGVERFEEAEVLQALVDSARFTTVVAEDGQMMTEMALAVRNNARQYLEIILPKDAQVWSAFVAGQPVRPSLQEDKLLLPMERSAGDDAPINVEVTYVGATKFPRKSGRVALESPALDVPLKNARWELYLPPDYSYGDFAGTMQREIVAAVSAPVQTVAWFGLSEYVQEESKKREVAKVEVQRDVSNVRSQLAGGNLNEALKSYSRARAKGVPQQEKEGEELAQLDKDLKQAQAQNLFKGQQIVVEQNAAKLDDQQTEQLRQGDYDERANVEQWEKLQRAQEITVVRALPLRVNLPKRGATYAFTQVLQTEVKKPMTVQFDARNAKGVSWPARIGLSVAGLVGLWAAVAGGLRFKG